MGVNIVLGVLEIMIPIDVMKTLIEAESIGLRFKSIASELAVVVASPPPAGN